MTPLRFAIALLLLLLPAWAVAQERAVEILEQIAPEKNTYTVPWSERGIRPDNAFFSQALIQLSKEYCEKKRCATCNIGKMLLCSQE